MCLIALSVEKTKDWNGKDSYFFIIIANRDEYHERPTTEMHWWSNKQILAGKDEDAGGTWLGTNKEGKFAAITNLKENTNSKYLVSRGELVTGFLESDLSAKSYLEQLESNNEEYAGFNIIVGDITASGNVSIAGTLTYEDVTNIDSVGVIDVCCVLCDKEFNTY